jgi:ribonuclease P protein component
VTVPGTSNKNAKCTAPARLLRHADFERVYKLGRRHFSASMTVFYLQRQEAQDHGLRIGLTVGRVLGGAVQRNRIKRRLREAVRLSPRPGVSADVVINPKKALLTVAFESVRNEVSKAFVVIEQKLAGKKSIIRQEEMSGSRKPGAGSRQSEA